MSQNLKRLTSEIKTISTIGTLTNVFGILSSVQIRAIRQDVLNAKIFFNDLWDLYSQLRVEQNPFGQRPGDGEHLAIIITSPLGLGGSSDLNVINDALKNLHEKGSDIVIVGSNGHSLLKTRDVIPVASFEVPDVTKQFSVDPLATFVKAYKSTTVHYHTYISLGTQKISRFEMLNSSQELTQEEKDQIRTGTSELITPDNFIFEPSIEAVLRTLREGMVTTALKQLLMESRLAQLAQHFTSMTLAHDRTKEMKLKLEKNYACAKRAHRDELTRQALASRRVS